ncbi:MAG: hypothetical protein Dbin4_02507 [Alphaproteobacteria bacterium]|nr:hypothetical protein [Alphaproteobacteria bacterium]
MDDQKCLLWGTGAGGLKDIGYGTDGMRHQVTESHRAGGNYIITEQALCFLQGRADAEQIKARLSRWVVDQQQPGHPGPEITSEKVERFAQNKPLPVHERADRLLIHLNRLSPIIGSRFPTDLNDESHWVFLEMLAWTESTTEGELNYLLNYLEESGWIKERNFMFDSSRTSPITVKGYARLAELATKQINSSQGFVAMWFDESLTEAYDKGIVPGIEDAGYKPLRIDKKEHANKIDDEIIAEIRRSRFLVADFTHGTHGHRGGVYYEAGFAHGLNIPVFFTCRKDLIDLIHFDTRQYNHIKWTDYTDLRKQLADRISAVIGDGPDKPPKEG